MMPILTAILLFSRLPQEEILHKKISSNVDAETAIWQQLYSNTLQAAIETSLPIIICSSKEQKGKGFAENITTAITEAFQKGYDNIIVLGGDCAAISKKHITAAQIQLLQGRELVVGKDMRGGIYLLAVNKKAFDSQSFFAFNWQTNKLFNDIKAYASGFSFSKLIFTLKDINTKNDLLDVSNAFQIKHTLKKLINTFFKILRRIRSLFTENIQSVLFAFHYILRGPPLHS